VKNVRDISPFSDKVQEQFLDRISEVSRAVLFGILGTALVQSLIAMIIFRIVNIPALLWGSLLGMCSLIPFIGTSLVWIPITIYFLLIGQPLKAVFVLFGCGGLVANVDNFMRPAFICGGRTGMSYIVLFCSLLGGLQTFGLAGVVYGPLISGLCALCLYIFGTQYKNRTM
jgi:predicted PurR-regulated permease PerM